MNTLQQLFDELIINFNKGFATIEYLTNILEKYEGVDWKDKVHYNDDFYNRIKLFENKDFDVYLLCWNAGQASNIHNHAKYGCVQKILQGEFVEILFDQNLKALRAKEIFAGTTSYIDNTMGYHVLGNSSIDKSAVSLHIYSPPNFQTKYF